MAEELQGLLEKIRQDGIQKADAEKEKILTDAKSRAAKIIEDAKAEAELAKKAADDYAKASEARAKSAIQQAARDIKLALRNDLNAIMKKLVQGSVGAAMTPELMGKVLLEMAKTYASTPGTSIEVLVNKKDLEGMEALLKSALLAQIQGKTAFGVGADFGAGLKVGAKGNDGYIDFTDEAVTEAICAYVGPRLAEYFAQN